MKNLKKYILLVFATSAVVGCSLDEDNYSAVSTDVAYTYESGYKSLINATYENMYYLYGKVDGIPMMEMGTDLWKNGSRNGNYGDLTNYNTSLTTSTGVVKVVWNALYCIVGYCNTAIYFEDKGKDFTKESIAPAVAEARFMRGFANFHIVEQWGNSVLNTKTMAEPGLQTELAFRTPETEFYDVIINDLKIAVRDLPITQADRGRATKKAALAMLAKAYLQRTRLYEQGSAEYKAYADSAYQTAKELIDNAADYQCGLYASTATKSGNAQVWDDENNKDNKEFLFIQAIDHEGGYNPEGWNRGRTSQYYMMKIGSQAQYFGVNGSGLRYGRDNATVWSPTLYLLKDCFEPKLPKTEKESMLIKLAKKDDAGQIPTTPDTRFNDAFYYKYYSAVSKMIDKETLGRYKKDTLVALKSVAKRRMQSGAITGSELGTKYPGLNIYCTQGANSGALYEVEDNIKALACYTPNWELDTLETAKVLPLAVGITDYFDTTPEGYGDQAVHPYFRNLFPSLKKHRGFKYAYTNQYCMQDQVIIRLTDIYLIAAEAAVMKGQPADGLDYLNAVRRHAAVAGDAAEMEVTVNEMNIDYLLKERARELCGEQWRWYDLKRTHRLTQEYLSGKGMNPYITTFDINKHTVRPIPQDFLDAIANPEEFGTNGY